MGMLGRISWVGSGFVEAFFWGRRFLGRLVVGEVGGWGVAGLGGREG